MPLVSVVMPTYNRGWVIERAIKSVLNQTDKDFELIIVDDGSRDGTKSLLRKIDDPKVKVYFKKHAGAASARNYGIRRAKSQLIAFLDSDNTWHANFLEVMKAELVSSFDLVYSGQNLLLIGSGKSKKVIGRAVRNEPYNFTELLSGNYIDTSSVLVRKKAVQRAGFFDQSLKTLEDWDLYARIAIKDPVRVKHVDHVLGEYYYYLKSSAKTVTNANFSELGVKALFGFHKESPDRNKITRRFQRLIKST